MSAREMLALDILTQSEPRKIKWWRNWEATFGVISDHELGLMLGRGPREMLMGDLCDWSYAPYNGAPYFDRYWASAGDAAVEMRRVEYLNSLYSKHGPFFARVDGWWADIHGNLNGRWRTMPADDAARALHQAWWDRAFK